MSNRAGIGSEKLILGIDPGTTIMGYSVLEVRGSKLRVVQYGVLRLNKVGNHALKLRRIFDHTLELINEYLPDEMAIEAQFFGQNVQSMLKLGRAQGVAIAAALSRDIPYVEYAPRKIKQSVTGNGAASKEQVAAMLVKVLELPETPTLLDATDALSVAVCHHFQTSGGAAAIAGKSAGTSGWKAFLTNNPGRVR